MWAEIIRITHSWDKMQDNAAWEIQAVWPTQPGGRKLIQVWFFLKILISYQFRLAAGRNILIDIARILWKNSELRRYLLQLIIDWVVPWCFITTKSDIFTKMFLHLAAFVGWFYIHSLMFVFTSSEFELFSTLWQFKFSPGLAFCQRRAKPWAGWLINPVTRFTEFLQIICQPLACSHHAPASCHQPQLRSLFRKALLVSFSRCLSSAPGDHEWAEGPEHEFVIPSNTRTARGKGRACSQPNLGKL